MEVSLKPRLSQKELIFELLRSSHFSGWNIYPNRNNIWILIPRKMKSVLGQCFHVFPNVKFFMTTLTALADLYTKNFVEYVLRTDEKMTGTS